MDDQGQQPTVPGGSGMPVSEPQQPAVPQPSAPPTGEPGSVPGQGEAPSGEPVAPSQTPGQNP